MLQWQISSLGLSSCEFRWIVDVFSCVFFITVISISFRVFNFRFDYIKNDLFKNRFHLILVIFVCSIILLIFSPNLVSILLGWDGLGVRSYLLVIYYNNNKSFRAGILTLLTNRLGDGFLITRLGLVLIMGNNNFNIFSYILKDWELFLFLFLLRAFTKRAQIPFRAWLPAAIAAPTPVSSLVHSRTLVTAGVYILIRLSTFFSISLINYSYLVFGVVFFISSMTILKARLSALLEKDIKKIIALSTLSQLGVIIIAISLEQYWIAFIHLIAHAFFKALWFVRGGGIIHNSNSYQSIYKSGRLINRNKDSIVRVIIAILGLCAAPFLGAYYTKEPLIEYYIYLPMGLIGEVVILRRVSLTFIYRFRFIFLINVLYSWQEQSRIRQENWNIEISRWMLDIPAFFIGNLVSFSSSMFLYSSIVASNLNLLIPRILFISLLFTIVWLCESVSYLTRDFKKLNWIWGGMYGSLYFRNMTLKDRLYKISFFSQFYREIIYIKIFNKIKYFPLSPYRVFIYETKNISNYIFFIVGFYMLFFLWK